MSRIHNFSAGPAKLPEPVLQQAREEFLDYNGTGMSIMEQSHRGAAYSAVHEEAIANYRKLLGADEEYAVLFVAGGASTQFALIPMNFLPSNATADYIHSGAWAGKAIKEAKNIGNVNIVADVSADRPTRVPRQDELSLTPDAAYLHYCSNETISGAQYPAPPETDRPLIADMSSDILSRPIDMQKHAMIYAGAQKNIGPAGIALVVVRRDLLDRARTDIPGIMQYKIFDENDSLYNTPPSYSIYLMMLVSRWLLETGLDHVYEQNRVKADTLYAEIDQDDFYRGTAADDCRSIMNVTFRLSDEELEARFAKEADSAGLSGLKGHRSVGGLRASIYNAMQQAGVDALVEFMREFRRTNG